MAHAHVTSSPRQARRSFWALVAVSVLAAGALSDALSSPPSPGAGLRVAGSGLLLIASIALAARVLHAIDRAMTTAREASTLQVGEQTQHPRERKQR